MPDVNNVFMRKPWAVRQLKQPDLATIQFKTTLQDFSLQLDVLQNAVIQ